MSENSLHDVYVDTLLTAISVGYVNADYIAWQIDPVVPIPRPTGFVPTYMQSDWFRNNAHRRGTGIGMLSRSGSFNLGTDTYAVIRDSLGFELADEVRDATMEPYSPERDGPYFATDKIVMAQELAFAVNIFTTGVWTELESSREGMLYLSLRAKAFAGFRFFHDIKQYAKSLRAHNLLFQSPYCCIPLQCMRPANQTAPGRLLLNVSRC